MMLNKVHLLAKESPGHCIKVDLDVSDAELSSQRTKVPAEEIEDFYMASRTWGGVGWGFPERSYVALGLIKKS